MAEIMVTEVLETISLYDLDCSLNDAVARLVALREKYHGKELWLDLRSRRYDDEKEYAVVWKRPENEKERTERLQEDAQRRDYRRAQYEQLKREFGD